jgi:hypothetical protein
VSLGCIVFTWYMSVLEKNTNAGVDEGSDNQKQWQRRNVGGREAPTFLKPECTSEGACGVVDTAGITVQQPLGLQRITHEPTQSCLLCSPAAPSR